MYTSVKKLNNICLLIAPLACEISNFTLYLHRKHYFEEFTLAKVSGFGLDKDGHPPHSSEVEQALIGLLMLNNDYFDEIEGYVLPEHFYVKFHGAIYDTICVLLQKGFEANPITIRENMKSTYEGDGDLVEHLASIMENASHAFRVKDLAELIQNYYQQRQLIMIGEELSQGAQEVPVANQETAIQTLMNETEHKLFQLTERGTTQTYQDLKNPLKAVLNQIEEAKKNKGKLVGVTTGLKKMDEMLGGLHKGELVIVAARPSMGKTALAINFAQNAATALNHTNGSGAAVGVFSMEMSAEQLTARIMSSEARVNSHKITDGSMDEEEFSRLIACANTLNTMQIIIDDTPQLPIATLRSRVRKMKRQYDIGMIVVDYLQLMRGSSNRVESRVQEISEISQGLKGIAREMNIPVVALSQLSRSVESRENKRPIMSDLRESGSIEQDADVVMFIYREEYYLSKTMPPPEERTPEQQEQLDAIQGKAEIIISKNRKGPTGNLAVTFLPQFTQFCNYMSPEELHQYQTVDAGSYRPMKKAVGETPSASNTEDAPWG